MQCVYSLSHGQTEWFRIRHTEKCFVTHNNATMKTNRVRNDCHCCRCCHCLLLFVVCYPNGAGHSTCHFHVMTSRYFGSAGLHKLMLMNELNRSTKKDRKKHFRFRYDTFTNRRKDSNRYIHSNRAAFAKRINIVQAEQWARVELFIFELKHLYCLRIQSPPRQHSHTHTLRRMRSRYDMWSTSRTD